MRQMRHVYTHGWSYADSKCMRLGGVVTLYMVVCWSGLDWSAGLPAAYLYCGRWWRQGWCRPGACCQLTAEVDQETVPGPSYVISSPVTR